jgi:hypothetical protein
MNTTQQQLLTSLKGRIVSKSGSMRKAAKLVSQLERLYPEAISYRENLRSIRRANRVARKMASAAPCGGPDLFAL